MVCANKGHIDAAKELVYAAVDVNQTDIRQNTALMHACKHKDTQMVEFLLEAGADPSVKNGRNKDALSVAAQRGLLETCLVLLEQNGNYSQ